LTPYSHVILIRMKSGHLALLATLTAFPLLYTGCGTDPIRRSYTNGDTPEPKAVSTKPDLLKRAQNLYSSGDYAGAIAALDGTPENKIPADDRAEVQNLKGLALLAEKKPLQAEESFRKAMVVNRTPEYKGYYQYNLATAQYEEHKSEDAAATLQTIDVSTVDQAQQKKIYALKERIGSTQYAEAPAAKPGDGTEKTTPAQPVSTPTAPLGSSVANPSLIGGTVVIQDPSQIYKGPVTRTRIGLLLPLSGKYEAFGKKAQRAIELAFQNFSDAKAKEYEIIPMDSGDTAESQQEALKKLVEENQVIAVIGPLLSKGIDELAAKAAYYQVPLISIAQVQGPVASHLFSCSISTKNQIEKVVDYAMRVKGYSKFAVLAPSNKAGEEMAQTFWDEVDARKGEMRAFELYDPNITDFRQSVDKAIGLFYTETRAKELKDLADKRKEMNITKKTMKTQQYFTLPPIIDFDAVFIADEAKTVGQIIPTFAYRDAKHLPYLGITSWNSNQLISRGQDEAEGATFPVAFNTIDPSSGTKAFYDLYVATYNSYPGELDAIAFDSAALVLKALRESPSTRDDFRKTLETLKSVEGATGVVDVSDHRCTRNLALYTVKGGKFITVADTPEK
jgi:ABC-type branched-subunit amino acid transport system substrate-binding protein